MGGISLSDTYASVTANLGRPLSSGTYQGEDDGGIYTGSTMLYPHLELYVDNLRGIERLASTGPSTDLPYGLTVGMSLQSAANLLRFVPVGLHGNSVAVLPVCDTDLDTELHLRFQEGVLAGVEILQYGP